jgi:ATP-binding cassette subfamily B protein
MTKLNDETFPRIAFPIGESHRAIELVGRAMGMPVNAARIGHAGAGYTSVGVVAAMLDVDADLILEAAVQVEKLVRQACPGLIMTSHANAAFVLAVIRVARRSVFLLTPDSTVVEVAFEDVCDAAAAFATASAAARVDQLLQSVPLAPSRTAIVRRAIARSLASDAETKVIGWKLRPAAQRPFLEQLRLYRVPAQVVALMACNIGQYLCSILGGLELVRGALAGRVDFGWLLAWGLFLLTAVTLQIGNSWLSTGIVLETAKLLKRRLFVGAMQSEADDDTRRDGLGRLLGRVLEGTALENAVINGAIQSVLATGTLAVSFALLLLGTHGPLLSGLLFAWCAVLTMIGVAYARRLSRWIDARMDITNSLIEKMLGHRTRIAQLPRSRQHQGEDQELEAYLGISERLDHVVSRYVAIAPNLWLIAGLAILLPGFLHPGADPSPVALSVAGVLVAQSALQTLLGGVHQIAGLVMSWRRVGPTFRAGGETRRGAAQLSAKRQDPECPSGIMARNLRFAYGNGRLALDGVSLTVQSGERVLIEGASGGGKSTLGMVFAGLRPPTGGVLLVDGLDLPSLGLHRWRRHVVLVPQFHENHLFAASLDFNLLMGRGWPSNPDDRREAEEVCQELGLGDLLDRMPNRLQQLVGETGWQLSQGERSRVFVARALLQRTNVVILDESLGALDPETHERVLDCIVRRARTVVLIAHP